MPDIRMPDGTILRNVPDGTPRADVERKWKTISMQSQAARHPVLGPVLGALSGAADQITLGAGDEVRAGLDTINPFSDNSGWKNGFAKAYTENHRAAQAKDKQYQDSNPISALVGAIGGGVLPAFLTGGSSAAASNAPRAVRLAQSLALPAAQGAAYAFNSGNGGVVNRAKEIPKGVAYAVGGNLAGRAAGSVASRVLGGQNVSANARLLANEGITLTPGQRAGRNSVRNVVEDKVLGSIPFVSAIPEAARNRGANDLRVAVANRVLAPIGENVPQGTPIGNDAIGNIQTRVYDAFDNAAGNLSLTADPQLAQDFAQVAAGAPRMVGTEAAGQVTANIDHLNDRMSFGPMTGDTLREMLGELRGLASTNPGQMGQQFWALHDNIVDAMGRQNAPEALTAFNSAREATALLKRMEGAASGAGVVNGEFGPTQLLQAAKKRGFGTTTGNVANGDARLMDIANAAADVMRNQTANSGTPGRLIGSGLLAGGTGAAAMIDPTMGALTAGSLLGYVPGIDRILQNIALNRPDSMRVVSDRIRASSPYLGGAGTGAALGIFGSKP